MLFMTKIFKMKNDYRINWEMVGFAIEKKKGPGSNYFADTKHHNGNSP
jgi:hypothetical protein